MTHITTTEITLTLPNYILHNIIVKLFLKRKNVYYFKHRHAKACGVHARKKI